MKLGSLFDGSGGFPLAGFLCGIEPVWASEVEPYPIAVTKTRFPNMKHLGDISKINGAEIEPVDIITFGSPCQDLSVAGKRAGLKHEDNGDDETTRSGLFMEAVRIIKEMREKTNGEYPRFAVWENVPGAFSSNKGEDFRIVLEELIKVVEPTAVMPAVPQFGWAYADSYCGDGWSLAYRVFDAQYWGVPQRRRRIYLVADFGGQCAREVLFEREGLRGYFTEGRTPWQTTPADAKRGIGANDREGEIPYTLKIRSGVSVDSYGKAAGKGALIQKNLSATLGVSQDQYLFQPVGADPYNGDLTGDKSATLGVNCGLSTGRNGVIEQEPNAVSFQWQAGAEASLCVAYSFDPSASRDVGVLFIEECGKTLTNGTCPGHHDGVVIATPSTEPVLTASKASFFMNADENLASTLVATDYKDPQLVAFDTATHKYIVRRLTPTECARLQGFADRWGDIEPKTEFTDEEYRFWHDVRNTHAAINGKAVKEYNKKQMLAWYNKLHTDSAEYKLWGNGIALPTALYVIQGIAEVFNYGT